MSAGRDSEDQASIIAGLHKRIDLLNELVLGDARNQAAGLLSRVAWLERSETRRERISWVVLISVVGLFVQRIMEAF